MLSFPGPKPRFLTGHLSEFRSDRLSFFTHCARTYGDIVPLRLLRFKVLLLSRPELIEQVLVTQSRNFIKHFGLRFYKPLLGEGLVTSEGDFWRRQRKLSAPAFQSSRLAPYADTMVASTSAMLSTWREEGVRDIHADMMRLTLDIAVKTLFGADVCPDTSVVGSAMEVAMHALAGRWRFVMPMPAWVPTPGNRRFRRAVGTLDAIVTAIVARRRAAGAGGDDLLSMLLEAQDEDGAAMTERQLQDEVRTIFLAGHETTALALSYAIHLLSLNPQSQVKLREELAAELGDRTPTYADLPRLTYTRKVVTETMRLYPPADFLGREAIVDCRIGDIDVPKGTNLFMSQWVMHRDSRFFTNPDEFIPDRWTESFEKSLPRFAYFPFGGGPRFCIGQTFAQTEAILALAVICANFTFSPDPSYKLELWPNITLRPRNGLRVFVHSAPAAQDLSREHLPQAENEFTRI